MGSMPTDAMSNVVGSCLTKSAVMELLHPAKGSWDVVVLVGHSMLARRMLQHPNEQHPTATSYEPLAGCHVQFWQSRWHIATADSEIQVNQEFSSFRPPNSARRS